MDPIVFRQLNEAYHRGVYSQENFSEEEYLDIQEWVEALIDEGYDLDQYSDDELYEAYLTDSKNYQNLSGKRLSRVMRKAADLAARKEMFRHPDVIAQAQRRGVTRKKIKDSENEYDDRSDKIITIMGKHDPEMVKARETQNRKTINVRATPVSGPALAEELDLYDLVSEYLVSEGFCDSYEDADVIMANMSEEWREGIVEEVLDEANRPEREMIKKGLLKPGQVERVRNLNRAASEQGGSDGGWYDQDPRNQPSIQRPGRSFGRIGPMQLKQRRQREAQKFDAFYADKRKREHRGRRGKKTTGG